MLNYLFQLDLTKLSEHFMLIRFAEQITHNNIKNQ